MEEVQDVKFEWSFGKKRCCNKNRLTDIEDRLVVAKGEGVEGGKDWEFGISRCKL